MEQLFDAGHGAGSRESDEKHDAQGPDPREARVPVAETDQMEGKPPEAGSRVAAL